MYIYIYKLLSSGSSPAQLVLRATCSGWSKHTMNRRVNLYIERDRDRDRDI